MWTKFEIYVFIPALKNKPWFPSVKIFSIKLLLVFINDTFVNIDQYISCFNQLLFRELFTYRYVSKWNLPFILFEILRWEVKSGENIYLMTGKVDNYLVKVSLSKFAHPKISR